MLRLEKKKEKEEKGERVSSCQCARGIARLSQQQRQEQQHQRQHRRDDGISEDTFDASVDTETNPVQ